MAKRKTKKKSSTISWIIIVIAVIILGYFLYPKIEIWVSNFFTTEPVPAETQSPDTSETNTLTGATWVSEMDGSMLTFKSNGSFVIELPSVEERSKLFGHFLVNKSTVIFVYHPSTNICVGMEGRYKYSFENGSLDFKLIGDPCKSRRDIMKGGWFKL